MIFILVLADVLLGNQLALAGSPYPVAYLAAHIVVTGVVVAFAAHATYFARTSRRRAALGSAVMTTLCALGAAIAGAAFLLEGEANGPLLGMEVFGGLALLGSILLVAFG